MPPTRSIEFRQGCIAHASGAIYLPADSALLIADVHLGYTWAQRRRGSLGPLSEGGVRELLLGVVEELKPRQVVVLGDLVHAPRPMHPEREAIESAIAAVREKASLLLVQGNHDRAFQRDFGHLQIPVLSIWEGTGVSAVHGDRRDFRLREGDYLFLGHWHPTVKITDAANVRQRLRAFLAWPHCCVLPAFSPFAAGFDIGRGIPEEMAWFTTEKPGEVIAASGRSVVKLGATASRPRRKQRPPIGF